jgi:hypothetical protein
VGCARALVYVAPAFRSAKATSVLRALSLVLLCLALGRGLALGQTPARLGPVPTRPAQTGPAPPLRIYLDCWQCDTDYLRQHVLFIEYVRDRATADLHVLVTTQTTGGGGTAWTMSLIGLGRFHSRDHTAVFHTPQSATADEQRREFARRFRLALAGYAADTVVARDLTVHFTPAAVNAAGRARSEFDPWRGWLFRISGSANGNAEAATRAISYRGSLSASRVTDSLKINFTINSSETRRNFTLSDGREVHTTSDSWNVNQTTVRTVAGRVAAGARLAASHSSFDNRARALAVYPGVEFNVFSYSEYERRRLTVWYEAGPNYYEYHQLTIFDKTEEMVPKQQIDVSFALRQPWGYTGISTSVSHHLNAERRYNASVFGETEVRLFNGFSLNVWASYSKINDQISLPKQDATTEEILLRLRHLETNYSYSVSMGLSYSFGSIFTSIVNPRFSGSNVF